MGYSPQKKPFDLKDFLSKTGTRRPSRLNARFGRVAKDPAPEAAPGTPVEDPDTGKADD